MKGKDGCLNLESPPINLLEANSLSNILLMKAGVKKYNLHDNTQSKDTIEYREGKSIQEKLEVLDSLREDAIKMGLYPDFDENKPRLQRI